MTYGLFCLGFVAGIGWSMFCARAARRNRS
jgi:hypothetical protein